MIKLPGHQRAVAAVFVVAAHLAVMVYTPAPHPRPQKTATEVRVLEQSGDDPEGQLQFGDGVGMACKDRYIGIGLRASWGSGTITELARGGPAHRAGVQIGDTLLSDDYMRDMPVGTPVVVRVGRGDRVLELPMLVAEICIL